jgi:malonyl-CoA O-methyltransferase
VVSDARPAIERARVARLFDRIGAVPSFIDREVAQRMAERLDYIRIDAARVLDAGCGAGADLPMLAARFAGSLVLGVDRASGPLRAQARAASSAVGGSGVARWVARKLGRTGAAPALVCADFQRLPLARASLDVIWSNLALHWDDAPHRTLIDWGRVLRDEGLVMFSAFGPDTLAEVRRAFAAVDARDHSVSFTDMHDYGDMLVAAGFAAPVVDMEQITLTYSDSAALWRDVRALGGNPLEARQRGLYGRGAAHRLAEALEAQRASDGSLRLTFEVIYGHAWKGVPRVRADGRAVVSLEQLKSGRAAG